VARAFHSIYRHGFVRVAACVPRVRVGDPAANAARTIALAGRAVERGAALAVFPELGLTAYSNEDLFHQDAMLDAGLAALDRVREASTGLGALLVVGAPLRVAGRLLNCAVAVHRGKVLAAAPKTYLPNYREFYEQRQFTSARDVCQAEVELLGERVPLGNDLVIEATDLPGFALHVEVCEDLWVPIPPSTYAALGGATVLANLSASNITIGKAEYRRSLCASQSAKTVSAYVYAAAGAGESTTDLAWDGHAMIWENGELLAETERFALDEQVALADVDLDRLRQDRMRLTSLHDSALDHRPAVERLRRIPVALGVPEVEGLLREVPRFPYVPSDPRRLDERCFEAYHIQVQGLATRLESTGIRRAVIGVSGGLDSTQALLVTVRAFDRLRLPRSQVLAYTLPGFATSEATLANARALMSSLGVTAGQIDIRPSCLQMLKDLGHPFAAGEPVYDVTFENVQAGERTSHLFRLANRHAGLVVGTGDLSELALGWCTYGVGDQMAHYNVNASVPKTLIRHLIRWTATSGQVGGEAARVLEAILATPISPELVPSGRHQDAGEPVQRTEAVIGPFDLQDFNLYWISRFGFRPSRVAFLALHAWGDRGRGSWPPLVPESERRQYDLATIKHWLEVFLRRFFGESQFKRSATPNAPKVGSGGSLSPRGDWRAPSDASAEAWLAELREGVP
jgi:NAD+ synthase (glutamine-hydrolysing)